MQEGTTPSRLLDIGLGSSHTTRTDIVELPMEEWLHVAMTWDNGAYAVYAKLFLDRSPQGFTALVLTVIFVSGVHLFFLGVIGEYVGRIYQEAKRRPLYVVDYVVGGAWIERGAVAVPRSVGYGMPEPPRRPDDR